MRGVVWLHRDKVFSRSVSSLASQLEIIPTSNYYFSWKERFIVVTKDYLQCYKRVATEASQMGPFLHQVDIKLTKPTVKPNLFVNVQ